jgi:hypothetical protein
MGNHAARFYCQMNLANSATLRAQKGSQLPEGESMKTVNHIKLNYQLLRLITPTFPPDEKGGSVKVSQNF